MPCIFLPLFMLITDCWSSPIGELSWYAEGKTDSTLLVWYIYDALLTFTKSKSDMVYSQDYLNYVWKCKWVDLKCHKLVWFPGCIKKVPLFMRRTSCQGSWQGRIPSVRWPPLTTNPYCLPGHRTEGCGHAGTPARSAPGHSGLEMHARRRTVERDAN